MGVANPYLVYRTNGVDAIIRDTLDSFFLADSDTLYLSSIKDLGQADNTCSGAVSGEVAFTILDNDNLKFNFSSEKDIIGICEIIGLDTLLKPNLPGSFYINGILAANDKFNAEQVGEGKHAISYTTTGRCPSTEMIYLVVVPAPILEITPVDTTICPGYGAEIKLSATGKSPFKLKYAIKNIQRNGVETSHPFERTDLPLSIQVRYSSRTDSLRVVTPLLLSDRFGCVAKDLISSTVHFEAEPDFELWGRYVPRDGEKWKSTENPFIIAETGEVEYKINYTKGSRPWYCEVLRPAPLGQLILGPIYGSDTIYKGSAEGKYTFSVKTSFFCTNAGRFKESYIFHKEEGYMQIRTLLQGAIVERAGEYAMHSELQRLEILQKEGLRYIPSKGTDSITDFIVASLYAQMDLPPVAQDTFLLRNDGQLLSRSGSDTLVFVNTDQLLDADRYYVVLSHRNHLSVMSAAPVPIVSAENKGKIVNYDFRASGSIWCQASSVQGMHMTEVAPGVWCMAAGYKLADGELVSISNPNFSKFAPAGELQGNYPGYFIRDINMNGIVEYPSTLTAPGIPT